MLALQDVHTIGIVGYPAEVRVKDGGKQWLVYMVLCLPESNVSLKDWHEARLEWGCRLFNLVLLMVAWRAVSD